MNVLGIDYGLVYMGLAISREGLPRPLTVIKSKSDQHKISEIIRICEKEKVDKIVIGAESGGFINKLIKVLKIEVVTVDETLTNKIAFESMMMEGIGQKKRKELEHAFAAAVILKIYEDNN